MLMMMMIWRVFGVMLAVSLLAKIVVRDFTTWSKKNGWGPIILVY